MKPETCLVLISFILVTFSTSGGQSKHVITASDFDSVTYNETLVNTNNSTQDGISHSTTSNDKSSLDETASNDIDGQLASVKKEPKDTNEEEDHPCKRKCTEDTEPMTCKYNFLVKWYQTMSKACYDCPFNITNCQLEDCIPADGVKRPILVVNRQLPGPAIEVCLGDVIQVVVENGLMEEGTSIHWHGHHQRGTPYMDGVPFITQCPISPKSKFQYTFKADTPGTHFWHSHSALQRGDGMFGSLIVRVPLSKDPNSDLFDFDLSEHTMVILDWAHSFGVEKFVAHHHSNGDNKPNDILVNGKGHFQEFEDEYGSVIFTPLERFDVEQNFRYRFRIINAGYLNCPIEMSIDNHTLVVVSSDGSDLEPVEAQSLVIYAGERFDFIVEMNQEVNNYWIRYRGLMDCDERFTSAHQVAILHYKGASFEDPEGDVAYEIPPREGLQINSLNTASGANGSMLIPELKAAHTSKKDPRLKPEADFKFYISYDFYPLDNYHYHSAPNYGFYQVPDKTQRLYTPQLNHISMKLPPFPIMTNLHETNKLEFCNSTTVDKDCDKKYCECTHVLRVPLGAIVEMILVDKGFTYDANHPFHLHGYVFRVIGMDRIGSNVTVKEIKRMDEAGELQRNFEDAPFKDTVTVPDGGYTIVRWEASNPGYWLFHCHIEYHVELGMAIVFKVGEDEDFPPVPHGFPRCENYLPTASTLEPDQSIHYKNYNKSDVSNIDFKEIGNDDDDIDRLAHSFRSSASVKSSINILFSLPCVVIVRTIVRL